jgi:hypothetical protein
VYLSKRSPEHRGDNVSVEAVWTPFRATTEIPVRLICPNSGTPQTREQDSKRRKDSRGTRWS